MNKNLQLLAVLLLVSTTLFFACSKDDKPDLPPEKVVTFTDANLKAALVANTSININKDGEIQEKEAQAYAGKIDVSGRDLISLKGLDAFPNITELDCSNNKLTSLDVTHNPKLVAIYCQKNKITTIVAKTMEATAKDTTKKEAGAKTKSLKIAGNGNLKILNCSYNQLTSINVADNVKLENFDCSHNLLTTLDVSKNKELKVLDCSYNKFTTLDFSKNKKLERLDVSNNSELTKLNIANGNNAKIKVMNAEKNPKLTTIIVDESTVENPPKDWKKDGNSNYYKDKGFYITFEDKKLHDILVADKNINTDGDKEISVPEASAYNGAIKIAEKEITSLKGLEYFKNIKILACNDNKIKTIDVTAFPLLEELSCGNNPIATIDVSKNEKLQLFSCDNTVIKQIDLSKNVELKRVYLLSNKLSNIDISKNVQLTFFDISNNPITYLDLSANSNLKYLHCYKTELNSLDVSMLPKLSLLWATGNPNLESVNLANGNNKNMVGDKEEPAVDLTQNPKLTCIQIDKEILNNIPKGWKKDDTAKYSDDCSGQSNNEIVNIPDANFKKILVEQGKSGSSTARFNRVSRKLNKNRLAKEDGNEMEMFEAMPMEESEIKVGIIDTNNDGEIQVGEAKAYTGAIRFLTTADTPKDKKVADLTGIEAFVNLRALDCSGDPYWDSEQGNVSYAGIIEKLDVSKNTKLEELWCYGNQLNHLDISTNTELKQLVCFENKIETIDVAKHSALNFLAVGQKTLKELLLPENTNTLEYLDYSNSSQVANIDIRNYTKLKELGCGNNNLSSIDVTVFKELKKLHCYGNNIKSIDISKNTNLEGLDCDNNQLSDLDISKNKNLLWLYCRENQLIGLDVSNNEKLQELLCNENPELKCIQVSQEQLDNTPKDWQKDDTAKYSTNCGENNDVVYIPDANFKKILVEQGKSSSGTARFNRVSKQIDNNKLAKEVGSEMEMFEAKPTNIEIGIIDTNNDGEIQVSEAEAYTGAIKFITTKDTPEDKKVVDLTGIEAFVNLRALSCSANSYWDEEKAKEVYVGIIEKLDVSKNTKLEELNCAGNNLISLDISKNMALKKLYCYHNNIETIDVAKHSELVDLSVGQETLRELLLPTNTNTLEYLYFPDSPQVAHINISNYTKLKKLSCGNNKLNSIDVTMFKELEKLWIGRNNISFIDISQNKKLTHLFSSDNNLTSLDVSQNLMLRYLNCGNNQLSNLDISQNKNLKNLYCYSNQLTNLDISQNKEIGRLYCSNNQLTNLDVSNKKHLTWLHISRNELTQLKVTKNPTLYKIFCDNNKISSLIVEGNAELNQLNCENNQLKQLDVSKNKGLKWLVCYGNPELTCVQATQEQIDRNILYGADEQTKLSTDCGGNDEPTVYIPDANFKKILVEQGKAGSNATRFNRVSRKLNKNRLADGNEMEMFDAKPSNIEVGIIDTNNDGEIQVSEAEAYTGAIRFYTTKDTPEDKKVADLTGIEAFVNLRVLECKVYSYWDSEKEKYIYPGIIEKLDVSKNTKLEELNCAGNKLISLDVSQNMALKKLYCYQNKIEQIDVTKHSELTRLSVGQETLQELLLPKNTNTLEYLFYPNSPQIAHINISNYTKLKLLSCGNNKLSNIDVTMFKELERLWIGENNISSINISQNKKLWDLSCDSNNLTNLDVSQNLDLKYLYCNNNQLSTLDVSQNKELECLYCSYNQLANLDISQNKKIWDLQCGDNQLTTLDVSQNKEIVYLFCHYNQLTSLDVSQNKKLMQLYCYMNPELKCIQVSQEQLDNIPKYWKKDDTARYSTNCGENNDIVYIPDANFKKILIEQGKSGSSTSHFNRVSRKLNKNRLAEANGNKMEIFEAMPMEEPEIKVGIIDTNNDGEIQVSEAEAYTGAIRFYTTEDTPEDKKVADLTGIEAFVNLKELCCGADNYWDNEKNKWVYPGIIEKLDVSKNTKLKELWCYGNQLSKLDVSKNKALKKLACFENKIEKIDVTQHSELTFLSVGQKSLKEFLLPNKTNTLQTLYYSNSPQIANINISDYVNLKGLSCGSNNLNSIDVSMFKELVYLNCSRNNLTNLDISQNKGLLKLLCGGNQLVNLDISQNQKLEVLLCRYNQLKELNVSINTQLRYLNCYSNELKQLDVANNTELETLYCEKNQLTNLDVSLNTKLKIFWCLENPELKCIQVNENQFNNIPKDWHKEDTAKYSTNCGE